MKCNNCNNEIKEEDNFCIYCGTPTADDENISKNKLGKKLKIIVPILMVSIIVISIILIIIAKANTNKRTEDTNTINEETATQNNTTNETANNISEETTAENLLDEIYAKYPELKDKEGIICTDGTDYWLLDENGKKVYFYDLESFEQAKEKCGLDTEKVESTDEEESNINNEETTSSSSETTATGSQNDDYIPTDDNNNYVDEMPSQWSANIKISISNAYFNYNGQKCYPSNNFGTEPINSANYFCYLQDPNTLSNYDRDKLMTNGKGVEYYINNQYLGTSTSNIFNFTFYKNQNINFKVLAPYVYDFSTGKVVATNVTVYEESDTAENFYKNRHGTEVSIPLPSIWN